MTMKSTKTVRLGDVCEEMRERVSVDDIPLTRYVTTDSLVKNLGGRVEAEALPPSGSLVAYRKGDLLLSNIRPYLRKLWLADGNGGCSSDVIVLRPCHEINANYLRLALSQDDFFTYVMRDVSGTKMPRGKREHILRFSLPLPPLSEQRAIVARLDAALARATRLAEHFATIAQNADLSFKATLAETFARGAEESSGSRNPRKPSQEWPLVRLGDVCEIDGSLVQDYVKYADYPHIGIDSIEKETGILKGYRTVAQDKVKSGKYHFTSRHIIYSKIRPNLNKVAIPDFEGLCSADSYAILPKPNCDRKWLAYLMRSPLFLAYVVPISNTRAGMPKVNRDELLAFEFPLPPLSVQRDVVARLDAARARNEGIAEQARRGAAAAENLKKALLKEAFE